MILSNDCEDGSDEMLDHLSKSGEIVHLRNHGPYDDRGILFAALQLADRPKAREKAVVSMHFDSVKLRYLTGGVVQFGVLSDALPAADRI